MSLLNATSTGNILLARKDNAVVISNEVSQQLIDTDYRSIKEVRAHQLLANIATQSNTTIDRLKTSTPIIAGDELIIKKNNGTFQRLIVQPEMISTNLGESNLIPTMIGLNSPSGIAFSTQGPTTAFYAYDKNSGSAVVLDTNNEVGYQFENNDSKLVKKIYIHSGQVSSFTVYGSTNGIDYTIISTETSKGTGIYTIQLPGLYSYYKFKPTSAYMYIYNFELLGDGYTIDTTSVTAGEIPLNVYKVNKYKFNEVYANENVSRRFLEMSGSFLKMISIYESTTFYPTRTLITQVDLPATGNQVSEITGQIYKLELENGSILNVGDTTTWSGANASDFVGDKTLIFTPFTTEDGFKVNTGTDGITDLVIEYEFATGTTCYGIKLINGLATEAIAAFQVFGSHDAITYVELLNGTQSVAIDDLTLTRYFNGLLYEPYKYYKIQITKGNTANGFVSCKRIQLLKEV